MVQYRMYPIELYELKKKLEEHLDYKFRVCISCIILHMLRILKKTTFY